MIVDELVLKLQADLADVKKKLAQVEADAAKAGKNAGENMGKQAGKGFDKTFKDNVDKTLHDVEGKAESSGSSMAGIFGKIGGAIAGAFALDKVVGFFKDSMKYAEEMQEEMGGVSKAAQEVNEDFENLGKKGIGVWNSVKLAVGTLLNNILMGFKVLAVAIADTFGGKNEERIVLLYQRQRDELKGLGEEMNKLSSINKRTADEELKLISLKEQLSDRAKKLGLDYDKLVASGKSWVQIVEEMQSKTRLNAQADLTDKQNLAIQRFTALEAGSQAQRRQVEQMRANPAAFAGSGANLAQMERALLITERDKEKAAAEVRAIAKRISDIDKTDAKKTDQVVAQVTAQQGNEARFLDSALRLKTIQKDLDYTIAKAEQQFRRGKIDEDERDRRISMAREEFRQATEYEMSSLRSGLAAYIEDTREAKREAIKAEADQARKLSYELLEAELKQAKDNEWEIQALKEDNADRLAEIDEAEQLKQRQADLESFAQTLQAANATTTGLSQILKAKDAGGALGGLGGTLGGLSQFKQFAPALGALGPLGSAVGAVGGIVSTLSGLFGKSDEERAREAAEQARRDEEAKKILELQANYQRSMLALQEAQAKLPFENLQRQLRLIDIESQQATLSGGNANTIETQRLARRQAAIQGTLTSESGTIAGGQLFGNVQSSPEGLIGFLSERGAQSLAIQQFVAGFSSIDNNLGTPAVGDAQVAALYGYRGKIPDVFIQQLDAYAARREDLKRQIASAIQDLSYAWADPARAQRGLAAISNINSTLAPGAFSASLGGVNTIASEINADTSIAENLLSTLEQSLANQKSIKDNTGKTAENTAKVLELRPDRERSFIDVGRGFIQSLGQIITTPSAMSISAGLRNFSAPAEIGTATLTMGRARTLQERMADALERQVMQGAEANVILNDILEAALELVAVMDGKATTAGRFTDIDLANRMASVDRRRI